MKTNQEYKNAALAVHRGNWAPGILAIIVFGLISSVCSAGGSLPPSLGTSVVLGASAVSSLLGIFILLPMEVGFYNAFKEQFKSGDNAVTSNMFRIGFTEHYWHNLWSMLLMGLKIFLWALLFIIPGIVKGIGYSMTPFIIAEKPEMKAIDAIHLSQDMMRGHKFDLFYLELTFLGWILLGFLTLFIGYLWLCPYMTTTMIAFYEDVKAEYEAKQIAQ